MDRKEIENIINDLEKDEIHCIVIETENNTVNILKTNKGLWKIKNIFGYLLYTTCELIEEISEWEEEIYRIY